MKEGFCENCGNKGAVHVHHIDRNRKNNSVENLMTLCPKCHGKITSVMGMFRLKLEHFSFISEDERLIECLITSIFSTESFKLLNSRILRRQFLGFYVRNKDKYPLKKVERIVSCKKTDTELDDLIKEARIKLAKGEGFFEKTKEEKLGTTL